MRSLWDESGSRTSPCPPAEPGLEQEGSQEEARGRLLADSAPLQGPGVRPGPGRDHCLSVTPGPVPLTLGASLPCSVAKWGRSFWALSPGEDRPFRTPSRLSPWELTDGHGEEGRLGRLQCGRSRLSLWQRISGKVVPSVRHQGHLSVHSQEAGRGREPTGRHGTERPPAPCLRAGGPCLSWSSSLEERPALPVSGCPGGRPPQPTGRPLAARCCLALTFKDRVGSLVVAGNQAVRGP